MRIAKNFLLALVLLVHGNLLAAATLEHEGIAIHEAWITLPDGVRLAADLYLPADIGAKKLPVLLEYLHGLFNPLLAMLLPASIWWSLRRLRASDPRVLLLLAFGLLTEKSVVAVGDPVTFPDLFK